MPELTKEWVLATGREDVESIMQARGEIHLMIFGHTDDGGIMAFPLNHVWGKSHLQRDIAIAAVRSKLKAASAKTYLAVSEAWMVDHRMAKGADVPSALRDVGSPSEHPDRIEVVVLIAGDATGTASAVYAIKRQSNGRFSHLEAYDLPGDGSMMTDGRLSDLLLDKGRAH